MIRVTIDLVTHKTGSQGQTLFALGIVNDRTGTPNVGNYDVRLYSSVPGGPTGLVRKAVLTGFPRNEEDAVQLVAKALAALMEGDQ